MTFRALHLFCGGGGFALGTQRAGFETVAAHDYLTGGRATLADLGTMSPAELRAACTGRPDVVFTSPPCKGNSGCLPAAVAATERYQAMNQLAFRGVWIALEAWPERPPAWHRPTTTLELAALQGLPVWHRDAWLDFGVSQGAAREIIGNMVPPPAAEAIAREMIATLLAARAGGLLLSGEPVWVRRRDREARP